VSESSLKMDNEPCIILETHHVGKVFGSVVALDDVSIKLYSGRVNTIVGENGAGKSTLMNILSGVYQDYEGEIYLEQKAVNFANPKQAMDQGIVMIHQELNLIADLSIAENVFLGREFQSRTGLIDYRRMFKETKKLLELLKLDVPASYKISNLKVGQQQVVEIAKALSLNARVIIMDEPTSAISDQEIKVLFDIIRSLKSRSVAIVYITHKMNELFQIGDYVAALRDGKLVGTDEIANVTHDDVVRMMVGRDIEDFFVKANTTFGKEIFRVEDLNMAHEYKQNEYTLQNINFAVKEGEVLGIYGLMGAGRTELFEAIFGLHPALSSGKIYIEGNEVQMHSPSDAINAGLALVPEDRKEGGLVQEMNLAASIDLACIDQVESFIFLNKQKEKDLASVYMERLKIKTPSVWEIVKNLSGGNQQKVVVAKWLATNPKVILMDEPTRGIDVNTKNEIYNLISELAVNGIGIIVISSELPEIMAISDRIIVLSEGKQKAELTREEMNEETIIHAALPESI
jgi:ribose transport system ATP-binding protein